MPTLDELREQRRQQQGQSSSTKLSDIREKRRQEMDANKFSYTEAPKPLQLEPEIQSTAGEAFKRTAAVNTLPTLAGIGGTAATMAAAGSVVPGIGTVGGLVIGLGVGIGSAILTKKAQDKALELTKGEEWKRNFEQTLAEDRKNHPFVTLLGETAPQLITFKPSPTTLKQAFNFSKRALTDSKSLSSHVKTLEGKTELDALINVSVGSGVNVSLEAYQQAREGDANAIRLISSLVLGGAISDPNRLGVKLGFNPSGDAIIEEYNKYGAQTEAAKIVTKGEIPIVDRGVDTLVMERQELASILRGESEMNRFTDPRILRAERIAGTIDKEVTPESDLNIYRLDGRSGPMRVGERVTANPHIADVYGGRVNPEATVKAGDLVRTSRGDYVYVPKSALSEAPALPPVNKNADLETRRGVLRKEMAAIKQKEADAAEAKRLAEEPERQRQEAEALAIKQQEDAIVASLKRQKDAEDSFARDKKQVEAEYDKQTKTSKITRARLQEDAKKAKAEEIKAIVAERKRIETEKKKIEKTRDQQLADTAKALRKSLNEAALDHVARLAKTTTKKQKVKENIRYSNLKATLNAKAVKNKKEIRMKAEENKKNLKTDKAKIKETTKEKLASIREQIKAIPKPALAKIDSVAKRIKDATPEGEVKPVVKKKTEATPEAKADKAPETKPVTTNQPEISNKLVEEATKYKSAEEFVEAQEIPKTVMVWKKSKFSDEGSYASVPVLRKEDNLTLYQGGTGEARQFWTPNKKYAQQFGDVKEKTGTFYQVDNGNRVTNVYVEAPSKSQLTDIWKQANQSLTKNESTTKPEPAAKTTTIGSKVVKSESIIKNAIVDAETNSKAAQALDESVTYQMGTTFVEQRKLSAELLAKDGLDETLRFAKDATDAEMNTAGINRSALYETLYKTIIREGQFEKYRDDLEQLAILVSDEVSEAAQKSSLHRMATENDPFRRIATLKKALLQSEKDARKSVFSTEFDDLYARLKSAGTDEDVNAIIKENLC